jgi:hypothetical protein
MFIAIKTYEVSFKIYDTSAMPTGTFGHFICAIVKDITTYLSPIINEFHTPRNAVGPW